MRPSVPDDGDWPRLPSWSSGKPHEPDDDKDEEPLTAANAAVECGEAVEEDVVLELRPERAAAQALAPDSLLTAKDVARRIDPRGPFAFSRDWLSNGCLSRQTVRGWERKRGCKSCTYSHF